jgi:hypothetical protein
VERGTTNREGIDGGRLVVALGAIMLLVSLFLDWYGFGSGLGGDAISAWTAFELVDLLLALVALAAIVSALEPMARRTSRVPAGVAAAAGPAALVLVIVSILSFPPAAQGGDADLEVGAWLALAGAAIMCAGALLALNRVALVVTPRERAGAVPHAGQTPSPVQRGEDARAAETETRPLPPRR